MNKNLISKKADDIIAKRKEENAHYWKCIEARICPKCGSKTKTIDVCKGSFLLFWKDMYYGPHCDSCGWGELSPYPLSDF